MFKKLFKRSKKTNDKQFDIKMKDYEKTIYVYKDNGYWLDTKLDEYQAIIDDFKFSDIVYEILDNNIRIECSDNVDFSNFHNIVMWLEEGNSLGVMRQKYNDELSYYVVPDRDNKFMDTLIGHFNDKHSLKVYLPEAFTEYGNLQRGDIDEQALSVEEVIRNYK